MTLLNRASNGHVPSMVALWRTARAFGPDPLPRAQLETLCGPRVKPDESRMPLTFTTWRSLGMFVESDGGNVSLGANFDAIHDGDIEALRSAVLALLLQPDNCPALLAVDLSNETEASRASDFVRVASWALAQDPYLLAGWNQSRALEHANAQGLELFRGDGRWPSFQEWAYFVGLGVMTRHGLLMTPARAMREILHDKLAPTGLTATEDVLLSTFLENLSKAIPVIDGGAYRLQIDNVLRSNGHGLEPHQVSPCLTLALLQLHHEEEIELSDRPGDVATRLSLIGRQGRVIRTASHIRRGTPRRALRRAHSIDGARS